ncbi:MAG: hypothetical protein IBX55_17725 [Methyloprofundus sp.]|nr:hypothetical protein [Methyloprofundus sp.]
MLKIAAGVAAGILIAGTIFFLMQIGTLTFLGFGLSKAIKESQVKAPRLNTLNPIRQSQEIIYDMGQRNIENAKRIQAENDQRMKDLNKLHDNEHPSAYPYEWDSIKNKVKVCWIHKKTRKKICEKIEN